ncbi:DUF3742 family protein [Pseudomonas sp. Y39-6]|uniref:DUF3742 family protein n=1 Tax=Pseudomonas sp. Y39-6 TaxID=2749807 RepID=UPI0019109995|nr:DUF3742 family protein [Pseudomonas sp. Y39-6]QPO22001.1 DUF3742 family protein [Pseudomonas sp. Y39-6]URS59322.1 DUF3742 family protein [Pseudomonas sp. Y39-6]
MDKKGFAHRAGYRLGRLLRASTRREALIVKWLAVKGVPSVVTATIIWTVKLLLLGALLYFTFWVALFYAILLFVGALQSWGLILPNAMKNDDGWRNGASGYGDYSGDFRVDAGRFDEEK